MRIGLDARVLNLPLTGVGLYVAKLIDYLVLQDDITCKLFSWRDIELSPSWQGKVEVVPLGGIRAEVWEEVKLPTAIKSNSIDVYHATWNRGTPSRRVCPGVLTIHDVIPLLQPPRTPRERIDRLIHKTMQQLSVSRARTVFADSQSTRSDIIKNLRVKPEKVITAHLGLPSDYAECSADEAAECLDRYGIHGPYFVFMGGIDRRKNIDRIIRAFAALSQKTPDIRLLILGQHNDLVEELKALSDHLAVTQKVVFPGYVPQQDKVALLKSASAMVYPSLYEGFGFPILEAMMSGCPVITSDRSSMPEVAGDAAIKVNPESVEEITSSMQKLSCEEKLRSELSGKGRKRASLFSWEKLGSTVLRSYMDAAGR